MSPFRRPASPLALEIYSPPADDVDSDGVLGSDDELDENALASRRKRIENLADAYLQGTPPFILSASLRGPFEKGWANPWRKERRRKPSRIEVEEPAGPMVKETDPRHRRHFYGSREQSEACSEDDGRTNTNQKRAHRSEDRQGRVQASRATPKRTAPWVKDAQLDSQLRDASITKPTNDNWLKRDRGHPGFREFDSPTSPTTKASARLLDSRNRKSQPFSARPQSSLRLQSPASITEPQSPAKAASSLVATGWPKNTRRSEPIVDRNPLHSARTSPSKQLSVPPPSAHRVASRRLSPEASFCVVSSSSQLPKFEYRRRKKRSLGEERRPMSPHKEMELEIPIRTQSDNSQDIDQTDQQEPVLLKPMSPRKPMRPSSLHNHAQDDQNPRRTFISTAASITDNHSGLRTDQGQAESRTTHGTTSKHLPSAQPVPPFPTMTDYAPSLHSMALPSNDSEHNECGAGPDPHLSTQAAFLHAQRSFQDDLASQDEDSEDHEAPTTSAGRRGRSVSRSANSRNITPFHRLNGPQPGQNDASSRVAGAVMPSTQYLVESVTPFTFSIDRKRHTHFRSRSGTKSSSKKPKIIGSEKPSPNSNYSSPELAEVDWRKSYDSPSRILSSTQKQSPSSSRRIPRSRSPGLKSENKDLSAERRQPPEHETVKFHEPGPESSQVVVTGSTATVGQDGQRDIAGESFNLSQAIADAGSWLQESFDLNRDLRQSTNHADMSSGSVRRSDLHLDTH